MYSRVRKEVYRRIKNYFLKFKYRLFSLEKKKTNAFTARDYNNYFEQVLNNYDQINNPFWFYEKLIDDLNDITDVSLEPLKEFANSKNDCNKIRIGLRHDIDADPVTAVRCSRALARRGLSGSFFFLHSAPYYGDFYDGVFLRNPELVTWVKSIVIAGSEIGLHNDAIGIAENHRINGVEHLINEIDWFRSLGTNIYGTVAHNNFLVAGAENYEVFEERVLYSRGFFANARKGIGTINFGRLNLEYEGTFASPKKKINKSEVLEYQKSDYRKCNMTDRDWTYRYFFENPVNDWDCDGQIWLVGTNLWIVAYTDSSGKEYFKFNVSLSKVISFLKNNVEIGARILLVLHPEYYSKEY
ncbi:hypothetical protein [Francisella sp. 19X1-34]|uniref:hypothetical protein n=1 Tax=Francisella sp. 19X1-34 TaxID=3087177 RepID=UPI002E2FA934|nr:hypothetical protein [Francisella sp. 19X1-34]MED7787549.1 hypothetical protein [Francisella sp. 19X1-34]